MTLGDFIYFTLVGFAIAIFLMASVLYLDLKWRERKHRRRREARRGYVEDLFTSDDGTVWRHASHALSPTRRTESSG